MKQRKRDDVEEGEVIFLYNLKSLVNVWKLKSFMHLT